MRFRFTPEQLFAHSCMLLLAEDDDLTRNLEEREGMSATDMSSFAGGPWLIAGFLIVRRSP